jgi:hypothetical protein
LKFLGEVGLERWKFSLIVFLANEVLYCATIPNAKASLLDFWIGTLRNDDDYQDAISLVNQELTVSQALKDRSRSVLPRGRMGNAVGLGGVTSAGGGEGGVVSKTPGRHAQGVDSSTRSPSVPRAMEKMEISIIPETPSVSSTMKQAVEPYTLIDDGNIRVNLSLNLI